MLNEFMKLGQVVEVRGQKIRARVFENKNGPILLYKGDIIKNVSVGSFIKIPKGFMSIIGRIEGEHISELREQNVSNRFQKESDSIERMIDISVLGVMEHGVFLKGMVEIPLVFSDVYILEENELQRVFSFFENRENAVALGNIAEYKNYKLYVDAQLLFASHIGIFGSTGSGKSNTLATIYTALFQKYGQKQYFKKSEFIIFDYNGEYQNAFTEEKEVYQLSTSCVGGNCIPVPFNILEEVDFWAVICEASEKTQRPFLERVAREYHQFIHCNLSGKKYFVRLLQNKMKQLFLWGYRQGKLSEESRETLFELLEIVLRDTNKLQNLNTKMRMQREISYLFPREASIEDDEENFTKDVVEPVMNMLTQENLKETDHYSLFLFSIKYRALYETLRYVTLNQYIEPMIKRFEMRLPYLRRLILPVMRKEKGSNVQVISFADVNSEFKRIITVLLCKLYYEQQKKQGNGSLHFIMDAAHHILHQQGKDEDMLWKDYGREFFEELIKEGRKFGAFLTISSQRPSDIPEPILSQMHNYFIHRIVNKEDIQSVGKTVVSLDDSSFAMLPVLPKGTCIFTGAASNFPVMVEMDRMNDAFMRGNDTIDLIRLWNGEEE